MSNDKFLRGSPEEVFDSIDFVMDDSLSQRKKEEMPFENTTVVAYQRAHSPVVVGIFSKYGWPMDPDESEVLARLLLADKGIEVDSEQALFYDLGMLRSMQSVAA